jgi:hypothetical protein
MAQKDVEQFSGLALRRILNILRDFLSPSEAVFLAHAQAITGLQRKHLTRSRKAVMNNEQGQVNFV